jgi:hypothetical protein
MILDVVMIIMSCVLLVGIEVSMIGSRRARDDFSTGRFPRVIPDHTAYSS